MDVRVNRVIKKIKGQQLRLALAESVTCGLIASRLGCIKDVSRFFMGSVICYHSDVKRNLLSVPSVMLKKYSAESMQVTSTLAKNLYQVIEADIYGAVTGVAAADPTTRHPAGTIFLCVLREKKMLKLVKHFRGNPFAIRRKAFLEMMMLVEKLL